MNDVHLETTAIDQCATGLDGVAERLTKAIGALEKSIDGLGQPWGTGEVGVEIGKLYEAVHEMALGCYEDNADGIGDYVSALDGTVALMDEFQRKVEKDVDKLAEAVAELYSGPPQQ